MRDPIPSAAPAAARRRGFAKQLFISLGRPGYCVLRDAP